MGLKYIKGLKIHSIHYSHKSHNTPLSPTKILHNHCLVRYKSQTRLTYINSDCSPQIDIKKMIRPQEITLALIFKVPMKRNKIFH